MVLLHLWWEIFSSKEMLSMGCSSWVEWWEIYYFQHSWTLTISDIVEGFSCGLVLGSYLGKHFCRQHFHCLSSTEFLKYPWEYVGIQGNLGEGTSLLEPCLQGNTCRNLHYSRVPVTPPKAVQCWALPVSQGIHGKAHVHFTLLLVGGLRRYFPRPLPLLSCGKKSNWGTIKIKCYSQMSINSGTFINTFHPQTGQHLQG